jgi:hypothetical protein
MDTHTTSTIRKIALVALGLLIVVTGLGLGASPASAYAPVAPRAIIAIGFDESTDFIRFHWAPPTDLGGKPVTAYQVERHLASDPALHKRYWQQSTTAPVVDDTVAQGVPYAYRVRAVNADGTGPWSETRVATVQKFHTEHWAFGTDVAAFVTRQYQDLLGRNPGLGEKQAAVLDITNGTWTTGDLIDALVARPERAHRGQIFRLYQAYFDRNADHAGAEYWGHQMTELGKTINVVSNSFASSAEFKAEYGNLTNTQFVTLVYGNVLDRTPDAEGLAFWTTALGNGSVTRGKVMTHFSESAEYKALSRGLVLAGDVYDAMLGKASSGSELTLWSAHIQAGGNAGDYGTRITLMNAY